MRIAVAYVYPMVNIRKYFALAKRFAETWLRFAPGIPNELHVIANGSTPSQQDQYPFRQIACSWHSYSNMGWDIGAFQWCGEHLPCDLLVCLGAPVHFFRPGWLERMVDAYVENGPGLYGCWAYTAPPHVRTTCFWLPPPLLNSYPNLVGSRRSDRYEFEHGAYSMTRHTLNSGMDCYMVTATQIFPFAQWANNVPGPENSLLFDQHIHR